MIFITKLTTENLIEYLDYHHSLFSYLLFYLVVFTTNNFIFIKIIKNIEMMVLEHYPFNLM